MRDVFISYARDDRTRAALLANVLEQKGWSVWWDRQIPPGRTFDEVIEEALTAARCVLVLWSKESIQSRWVRAEASAAADRGVLVPVLVEPVEPPLEFRNIQAANLSAWEGAVDDPELLSLFGTVATMVSEPAAHRAPPPLPRPASPSSLRKLALPLIVAVASTIAGVALTYLLMRQGSPERPAEDRAGSPPASPPAVNDRRQESNGSVGKTATPAAGIASDSGRIDLLAASNGGHLVRAPHENWMEPIDGSEAWDYVTGNEAVYAFKDDKPATFDTFRMLITETRSWNVKTFELLGASDSPTGTFQSLGTFDTQNIRLFPSPWQEFTFPPTRARYLKVRIVRLHEPPGTPQVEQWQLLGKF